MKQLEKSQKGIAGGLTLRFGPKRLEAILNMAERANASQSELCRGLIEGAMEMVESRTPDKNLPPALVRIRQSLSHPPAPQTVATEPTVLLPGIEDRIVSRVLSALQAQRAGSTTPPPQPV